MTFRLVNTERAARPHSLEEQRQCGSCIPAGPRTRSSPRFAGSSSMLGGDLLSLFVEPLERLGFDYMVTGSVASMLYGEPASRTTWTSSSTSPHPMRPDFGTPSPRAISTAHPRMRFVSRPSAPPVGTSTSCTFPRPSRPTSTSPETTGFTAGRFPGVTGWKWRPALSLAAREGVLDLWNGTSTRFSTSVGLRTDRQ